MDPLIVSWCRRHLGSPAVEQFFGVQRLSSVHGVRLADGREVVLKVRRAQDRQVACTIVHESMWRAGIPCPEPLVGPLPLAEGDTAGQAPGGERAGGQGAGGEAPGGQGHGGEGHAGEGCELVNARRLAVNAETWEGVGMQRAEPLGAAGFARLLARMVELAPPVVDLPTLSPPTPWLDWDHGAPGRIWPPPASVRWDPHRIEGELAGVVLDTARRSRARLLRGDVAELALVAGHGDFEAQNCRWVAQPDGTVRLVIHDWDSVVAMPEVVLAGNTALNFVSEVECTMATLAQTEEFLGFYATERGRPWSTLELEIAYATGAWVAAYNAAFEHLKGGPGPVTAELRDQAPERLRRAGA